MYITTLTPAYARIRPSPRCAAHPGKTCSPRTSRGGGRAGFHGCHRRDAGRRARRRRLRCWPAGRSNRAGAAQSRWCLRRGKAARRPRRRWSMPPRRMRWTTTTSRSPTTPAPSWCRRFWPRPMPPGAGSRSTLIRAYAIGYECGATCSCASPTCSTTRDGIRPRCSGPWARLRRPASYWGLDARQCRDALALAASNAGGIFENFGTMAKPYHGGRAAAWA
jgi:hypothetical protein